MFSMKNLIFLIIYHNSCKQRACGRSSHADDDNGGRCFCTDLWNKADTASAAAKHFGNAENRRYHTAHHHFDRSLRILTASGDPDKAA
jgi:hypothetical protein